MDWLFKFPQLSSDFLLGLKRTIDGSLRAFTRAYGADIENAFYPLQQLLIFFENVITKAPWPLVILVIATIDGRGGRPSLKSGQRVLGFS